MACCDGPTMVDKECPCGARWRAPEHWQHCPYCGRDLRLPVAVTVDAAESLARRFHDTYEMLAPQYGYQTRPDTKLFDPESANGRLMVAVVRMLFGPVTVSPSEPTEPREGEDA